MMVMRESVGEGSTAVWHRTFVNVRVDHKSIKRLIEVDRKRCRKVWNIEKEDVVDSTGSANLP
jgi:hypothetical protein